MTLDRPKLMSHLKGDEEHAIAARILDRAEDALRMGNPVATDFLDPFQHQVSAGILGSISQVTFRSYGGYLRAERRRLLIYPEYFLTELLEQPVTAFDVEVTSAFAELSHRDFLGALLATGLKREKLGDIVVTGRGCQVVVAVEIAPFLASNLAQVGKAPVRIEEIDLERLEVEPERVKAIKTTVASLRLDAIASSGFGTSRTRMAREIKSERVKLNWQPVRSPSQEVDVGDVVSIRGRGRVVVEEVAGKTRKGRISLVLKRYV